LQALNDVPNVVHVIQLAVAPVFLLTGVGAILNVLVNRLSRVVDRFRVLGRSAPDTAAATQTEMIMLGRRAHMIHWAIGLCTTCALLVCMVIATLFVGSMSGVEAPSLIAVLFITAMLLLVAGLLCFLREITLATSSIQTMPR